MIDFGHFPTLMSFFLNELTDMFYSSNLPHTYVIPVKVDFVLPVSFPSRSELIGLYVSFPSCLSGERSFVLSPSFISHPIAHVILLALYFPFI